MQDGVLDPRGADAEERDALRAWLALQEAGWRRPVEARAALARAPEPEAALRLLPRARSVSRAVLERHRAALARLSALAIPFGARAYPPRLHELCDAAPLLLVRGDPAALSQPCVAIVGSRAATAAGRETARSLAADLAALGFCVVSGLARGIDAAAHRGALEAGGRSVALLGCGLDVVYPAQHLELYQEIASQGALVSECPPSTEPRPHHFPLRNRLISGLAQVVVVVEARERSGSLTTAQHAIDQHRGLLVVPGAIDSLAHRGSNPLLRDSARVLLETDDVLRELGLSHHAHVARDPEAEILPSPARALLRALREEPATPDELARRLGRPPEAVAADLVGLELAGLVERERDGRLRARRTPENPRGLDSPAVPGGRGG